MRYPALVVILSFFLSQTLLAAAGGGGGASRGGSYSSGSTPKKSPAQIAVGHYKRGIKYRDKADKYEARAETESNEKKADKLRKKAQKSYAKAIGKYRKAIKIKPAFYQAHSSLGYALRKTGDVEGSLAAYDKSLGLNPEYPEAIEYRAETYLELQRFDDVKSAYMELFSGHPREYADQLMAAMEKWIEGHADSSSPEVSNFISWINERREISANTASLYEEQPGNWQN